MKTWLEESKKYLEHFKNFYHFLEYQEIIVDGLSLNNDDDFRVDTSWVYSKYTLFNKKYFNNYLPSLSKKQFSFSYESYYRGETLNDIKKENGKLKVYPKGIKLSKFRYYSEKEYCEALLHEMIHIKLNLEDNFDDSSRHGDLFRKEMAKLNNLGWDVPLFAIANRKISQTSKKKLSKSFVVIFLDEANQAHAFRANPKSLQDIQQYFKNVNYQNVIFKVRPTALIRKFPYVDDFKNNVEQGIPSFTLTIDEINELIKMKEKDKITEAEERKNSMYPQEFAELLEYLDSIGANVVNIRQENGEYIATVVQH